MNHLATWADWCRPVIRYDADMIDAALAFVSSEMPADDRRGIMWGDARVGNMIFGDDLAPAATPRLGGRHLRPARIGRHVVGDVRRVPVRDPGSHPARGCARPAGHLRALPGARGNELRDIRYYEVLAGLQLALINSRLADLLISTGKVPEAMGASFVTRVTGMIRRDLDRATG